MNQPVQARGNGGNEAIILLRGILEKQNELNALLQAVVKRQGDSIRQTARWKTEHPDLSKRCAASAKRGSELMTELIERLVDELEGLDADDDWSGNYKLFELIDKYGHKFQQFNLIVQTLAQLGTP